MINFVTAVFLTASNLTAPTGYGWVCPTLDKQPNESGVWQVVIQAVQTGDSTSKAGDAIVAQVANNCPEYIPLLQTWAKHNG